MERRKSKWVQVQILYILSWLSLTIRTKFTKNLGNDDFITFLNICLYIGLNIFNDIKWDKKPYNPRTTRTWSTLSYILNALFTYKNNLNDSTKYCTQHFCTGTHRPSGGKRIAMSPLPVGGRQNYYSSAPHETFYVELVSLWIPGWDRRRY